MPEAVSGLAYTLSHPARLQIARMLCQQPSTPKGISEALKLPQRVVSAHIGWLKRRGLIEFSWKEENPDTKFVKVYNVANDKVRSAIEAFQDLVPA